MRSRIDSALCRLRVQTSSYAVCLLNERVRLELVRQTSVARLFDPGRALVVWRRKGRSVVVQRVGEHAPSTRSVSRPHK